MKVVITHDWLVGGGAELVVLELHKMFPDAPIYTSYATPEWRAKLDGKVRTGYLQHLGFIRKAIPYLRARWFSHLNLSGYDLIISSSGAEAKYVTVNKDRSVPSKLSAALGADEDRKGAVLAGTATANRSLQQRDADKSASGVGGSAAEQTSTVRRHPLHVAYIHAPTHYYWSRYEDYLKHPGFGLFDPVARIGLKVMGKRMRKLDYQAAQRPDYLIANSSYTKSEIKKYYGRDSEVIHPPVDVDVFKLGKAKRSGFVITGRQTPYKRFDLAIEACTKLSMPLTVIGTGPEHEKLKELAGPTIDFKGWLPREEVIQHVQTAEAFIFPGIDDFGISAVEALAAGTPVIAYKAGGALDYVVEGSTGLFFEEQTAESLIDILKDFDNSKFDSRSISKHASQFSAVRFKENVIKFIGNLETKNG